eukprot:7929321-Alexandrium_andersonii.AAC.1
MRASTCPPPGGGRARRARRARAGPLRGSGCSGALGGHLRWDAERPRLCQGGSRCALLLPPRARRE